MNKSITYMIDSNSTPDHYVFFRQITENGVSTHDIWNSKSRKWIPDALAYDAFFGFDAFADPIEENEVLRIIAQHS